VRLMLMWAVLALIVMLLCGCARLDARYPVGPWPQYEANPFVFPVDIPAPTQEESGGGITVADLDNDGLLDYLCTARGHIACHGHDGKRLWSKQVDVRVGGSSEREGLPGHHGPGITAADIDGDTKTDVLYLTYDGTLHVVDGATGAEKWSAAPAAPPGATAWEHLALVDAAGTADRHVLLQATNTDGYRMGHYVSAFKLDDLRQGNLAPLWARDDFFACAHNGLRVADLNQDGVDEALSGQVMAADTGAVSYEAPVEGHIDSVFVGDIRPDLEGLEVCILEEGGGNRVFVFGRAGLVWESHYEHWEPQNAALGNFDSGREGLEVWCRSRFDTEQKPFVFDAGGNVIAQYALAETAPRDWTAKGVETIWTIDWTGEEEQQAAAKERHTSGDVAVFDPMTGAFLARFGEHAARLFVADVAGDWREELVVLNGSELHIYHNEAPNPRPEHPSLWHQPHYRRAKLTYNYYSP